MRARIVERLGWLGAKLDAAANEAGDTLHSRAGQSHRSLRRSDR